MVIIRIPFETPSVNKLYATVNGRRVMSAEGKRIKKLIAFEVLNQKQSCEYLRESNLKVRVEIKSRWLNKNATVKKKDIMNKEKFLIDAVFNALGLDDKMIWDIRLIKKHSEDEECSTIWIEKN